MKMIRRLIVKQFLNKLEKDLRNRIILVNKSKEITKRHKDEDIKVTKEWINCIKWAKKTDI